MSYITNKDKVNNFIKSKGLKEDLLDVYKGEDLGGIDDDIEEFEI